MELSENKVFGTKLTAEQIEKIEQILDFSEVSIDDLKTKGDVLNVILDNFSFEKESDLKDSQNESSETDLIVEPEKVYVKISEQLSPFHKEIVNDFIQNDYLIDFFEKKNENGKFDGVFNPINTDDKEQNIINLLVGVLIGSAQKMAIDRKVISEKDLKQKINDFVSEKEQ